ncbi:hypothetical protein Q8A67_011497 [Cirrhinus molitorella]|uniref:Uncharacterized protein n=1 Tax=Cirrhinus molitorella TaxID=172907 RepID=A0AA88TY43_9TELE|nr:hypothetical protein Q8A67_011497 [Cirrhinus molitorella]
MAVNQEWQLRYSSDIWVKRFRFAVTVYSSARRNAEGKRKAGEDFTFVGKASERMYVLQFAWLVARKQTEFENADYKQVCVQL